MQTAPFKEWLDQDIVFLLEVNWGGFTYRFSSFPVVVSHGSKSYQFLGGLPDPAISLQLNPGADPEGSSVPFALNFPVNIAEKQSAYNLIDNANAELSYVFQKNNSIVQDYNDRFIIYRGVVTNPVYGHPDKPPGYVEFSLEDRIDIEDIDLYSAVVGNAAKIDDADLTNPDKISGSPLADLITGDFIFADDVHKGKTAPLIIGKTGFAYSSTPSMSARDIKATPAYLIGHGTQYQHIMIAGHITNATNIKIYDNVGNSETSSIVSWGNENGDVFSFGTFNYLTGSLEKAWNVGKENTEYWAVWDTGGGLPSPYRPGPLEGGGDIIMWALSLATDQIDHDNLVSFMDLLNRYKFAGYVNEPITPIQFLTEHVIPYLPVELSVGPRGLRLIQNIFISDELIQPIETITANSSFFRESPIVTETGIDSIINDINLQYAKSGMRDKYNNNVLITPDRRGARWYESNSEYAQRSYQLFGRRSREIQCDYVYDYATAAQIAQDIVRANCFPRRTVEYVAAPKWGFLWIGDVISLTDAEIGLTLIKAQLIAKEWTGSSWTMKFELENTGL